MDPREMISFVRRRLGVVVVVVVLGLLIGVGYTAKFDPGKKGSLIFVTLGMEVADDFAGEGLTTNESHNVIDQFTETVQGWMRNPALLARIESAAGESTEVSVRKQEKQNLLITVTLPAVDGVDVDAAAVAVVQVLKEELTSYNAASHTRFVLALSSMTPFEEGPRTLLNTVVSGFLAFVFVVVFLAIWDFMRRRITFGFQVETLLGRPPVLLLSSGFRLADLEGFLVFYPRQHERHPLLVELGNTGLSPYKSQLKSKAGLEVITYPHELSEHLKHQTMVVFVKLGESSEDQLQELKLLTSEPFDYVLIV